MKRCSCAAKVPAGRGVHSLVVPLSFRCLFPLVSPTCYLSDGALTRQASLKAPGFTSNFACTAANDQFAVE
ncbi:hypothetical protein CEW81_24395 [Kluyvera genomosp. 3]|uniref:Uncharacterized protein n=1 Tax=Kluyvera genomosp. 3 TaxID=2774055 RepID=A0A248KMB6_9ENTR|nr:hypothetical protein CEW81_24395 [Kluyvera genomosp. 3]